MAAALKGDPARVQALLDSGISPDQCAGPASILALAAGEGNARVVRVLLECGADIEGGSGLSPLACAARRGRDETVRLLIERGADIEADADGPGTALICAAETGQRSTVGLLLALGADVDAQSETGATPLMMATTCGHLGVVVELIKAGAGLDHTSRSGNTALHFAAHSGSTAIVDVLVDAGADSGIANQDGHTAYDAAKASGKLGPRSRSQLHGRPARPAKPQQGIAVTATKGNKATTPAIAVDGVALPSAGWGRMAIPTQPGRHSVRVQVSSSGWRGDYGAAETTVAVPPGGFVELEYRPPLVRWQRGVLGEGQQRRSVVSTVLSFLVLIAIPLVVLTALVLVIGLIRFVT